MNKRQVALGVLAGFAGASLIPVSAVAGTVVSEAEASAAILSWLTALASHDAATVARILAPEFQIQRSDGSGFDARSYLSNLPNFKGKPEIKNLAFSASGDLLVTRYSLLLEQKIASKPVQALAPRLSVFRRQGEGWLISAHANFAQIG